MPMDFFTWTLIALFGLVIGSFLNVVIHRLPRMLEAQWAAEARAHADHELPDDGPGYNLALPASHCPHCHAALRWTDNIPVLSYLWLRGRCRTCQAPIGWRYPAVELLTCALFVWSFAVHGASASALAWAGFASALLALGYSGWGPGQLEAEIARNDWLTADAAQGLIFSANNRGKWGDALRGIGVDPLSLSPTAGRA